MANNNQFKSVLYINGIPFGEFLSLSITDNNSFGSYPQYQRTKESYTIKATKLIFPTPEWGKFFFGIVYDLFDKHEKYHFSIKFFKNEEIQSIRDGMLLTSFNPDVDGQIECSFTGGKVFNLI